MHAPLAFLLLKAWTGAWGDSVFAMRSLSALYGVLCVPLIYWTVLKSARLRWRKVAVIAPRDEPSSANATTPHDVPKVAVIAPRDEPSNANATTPHHETQLALSPDSVSPAQRRPPTASQPQPPGNASSTALKAGSAIPSSTIAPLHWGALTAAALVAVHPLQLAAGRTARMYSLGALLTLASTWLLLRALQPGPRRGLTWTAYAVSAAALLYTHNYGLLSVAAQLAFAFLYLVVRHTRSLAASDNRGTGILPVTRAHKPAAHATSLLGPFYAAGLILVLYSPWLPVLQAQTAEVVEGYWIPQPTWAESLGDVEEWLLGERFAWGWALPCVLLAALALLAAASMRHSPAALLFRDGRCVGLFGETRTVFLQLLTLANCAPSSRHRHQGLLLCIPTQVQVLLMWTQAVIACRLRLKNCRMIPAGTA